MSGFSLMSAFSSTGANAGSILGFDRDADSSMIQTLASSQPQEYRNFLHDMVYGKVLPNSTDPEKKLREKRYGAFNKYVPARATGNADPSIKGQLDLSEIEVRQWVDDNTTAISAGNVIWNSMPQVSSLKELSKGTQKRILMEAYNSVFELKKSLFHGSYPRTLALPKKEVNDQGYSLDSAFQEIMKE